MDAATVRPKGFSACAGTWERGLCACAREFVKLVVRPKGGYLPPRIAGRLSPSCPDAIAVGTHAFSVHASLISCFFPCPWVYISSIASYETRRKWRKRTEGWRCYAWCNGGCLRHAAISVVTEQLDSSITVPDQDSISLLKQTTNRTDDHRLGRFNPPHLCGCSML